MSGGWQRLDRRMLVPSLTALSLPVLGMLFALTLAGWQVTTGVGVTAIVMASVLVAFLMVAVAHSVRYFTTRYQISDERVELRSGLVSRTHRSIPRARVRSVDLTSGPLHRLLGLSVVKVGTGRQIKDADKDELEFHAVSQRQAVALRQELLHRTENAGDVRVIATLDRRWLRYAPLTLSTVAVVYGVVGGVTERVVEAAPSLPWLFIQWVAGFLSVSIVLAVLIVLAGAFLIGLVVSAVQYVEGWWGFRLEREHGDTLLVTRGLITTRSVTLEERRIRGVEIAEPLLVRWARGARTKVVATGVKSTRESRNQDALLPPATRAAAHQVAAAVLREPADPTRTPLITHPRVALRRRLVRAAAGWLVAVLISLVLPVFSTTLPSWLPWIVAVLGTPVAVLFGIDAYRNLGHGLSGKYLVTRSGTAVRRTVALRRSGVIGWRVRRSPFQRRAGLCTVIATTAAGKCAYRIRDVRLTDGLAFAEEAAPGILTDFLSSGGKSADRRRSVANAGH
ncbi:PH domain-containing protein [Fodinicola feengrottensis]|uniref:PH domain-containing protein n=1 Tax=Fodinicola feengrottensis TaxID=435914 RepID=A0ABN2HF42_9ACTN